VEDIDFWVDFVAGNSNKLQILGSEEIISWAFNAFTLSNLKIFNSENVKNKECVHTWANDSGYTSIGYNCESLGQGYLYIKEGDLFVCVVWLRSLKWWDPLSCSWYLVLLEIPWAVVGCIEVPVW
jgi:hypothetical protein